MRVFYRCVNYASPPDIQYFTPTEEKRRRNTKGNYPFNKRSKIIWTTPARPKRRNIQGGDEDSPEYQEVDQEIAELSPCKRRRDFIAAWVNSRLVGIPISVTTPPLLLSTSHCHPLSHLHTLTTPFLLTSPSPIPPSFTSDNLFSRHF